ncbi:MAG: Thiamine transporter ATP-binding protein [Actinomycetia bacterium]|nr:Thiamine transporter ATP-binding protein [Actinomycetes bacterium]
MVANAQSAARDLAGRYGLRRWTVMPATYLIAIVALGVTVVPLLFVVVDGFRTNGDINNSPAGWPHPWVAGNYTSILTTAPFWQFLGNSFLIAAVATTLTLVLGSMAALALSRYEFKGREFFYTVFVSGLLFPLGVGALPLYLLLQRIGLLDNQFGVAIPEAAFALPITLIILRPFLRAIPGELEDAALVDGAGRFRFFVQILLPLAKPALVTVGLLAFVTSWNQYLLPLLVLQTSTHFTLPLGTYTFQTQYSQNDAGIMAFTALAMVPALAVFVFAERYIVAGAAGAVKG